MMPWFSVTAFCLIIDITIRTNAAIQTKKIHSVTVSIVGLKRIISPIPLEIDGISIGITNIIEKILLNLIFVRSIHIAKQKASDMDITVPIVADTKEFEIAVPKFAEVNTAFILSASILKNILSKGKNTRNRNIIDINALLESPLFGIMERIRSIIRNLVSF